MRLQNKVAIVTGGAAGIGEATARLFAREGANVVTADILDREGADIAAAIVRDGGKAAFVHLDVSREDQWTELVRATITKHGRIDVLVNNAGISGAVTDRMSTEYFDRLLEVNTRGTFLGIKHVVPEMQKTGGGAIVNLSSISGIIGQPFVHMGYNAAKGAIRTMTKSAAVQFGPNGIRVNSVHPGIMPPMRTSVTSGDPKLREQLIATIPLRRAGTTVDAANAILFLASDEASYITGSEIIVDGGFIAA